MVIASRNRKYSDFVDHPRHAGKGCPRKEASPATYQWQVVATVTVNQPQVNEETVRFSGLACHLHSARVSTCNAFPGRRLQNGTQEPRILRSLSSTSVRAHRIPTPPHSHRPRRDSANRYPMPSNLDFSPPTEWR